MLGRDGEATLAHLAAPGEREDRVSFTFAGRPKIAGVAPDDGAVIVAIPEQNQSDEPTLLRIEPATGRIVAIHRDPRASYFAGWGGTR